MAWPSDLVRTKDWGTEILYDTDLEGQFDLIIDWIMAFANETTGHTHTAAENKGPKITLTAGSDQGVTGTLPVTKGGTGIATIAQGQIPYGSAADTISALAVGTSGYVLKTQGAGANPVWGLPGDLSITNQAQGDILYYNGSNWVRLAAGTSGKFLKTQGAGANPTWDTPPDVNTSNVIFCWIGNTTGSTNSWGRYNGNSLLPNLSTYTVLYNFFGVQAATYRTIMTGKFKKISGISTVTIYAYIWSSTTTSDRQAYLSVDIGGQNNYAKSVSSTSPTWYAGSGTIDVSGLSDGTVYDITIQLKNEYNDTGSLGYCGGLILFGS